MATGSSAAQPTGGSYFPPGCRLGIAKPKDMAPLTGDPRNLLYPDHTFQILFWDLPALGPRDDVDWWEDRPSRVTLLWERTVSPTEQRRLFEMDDFVGDANHSWFTFLVRTTDALGRPDWFGRLHLITKPMGRSTGERARWRERIEAVVASVVVRPALSVPQMLAEHGIAMDLAGLHPHHFGDKLVVSLAPPLTLADRWSNDCYIAMEKPPMRLPYPWDENPTPDEVATAIAEHKAAYRPALGKPSTDWASNGIDWMAGAEQPLAGTGVHVRSAYGYGRRRRIELHSYCRLADRAAIGAAFERIARSVRLDP